MMKIVLGTDFSPHANEAAIALAEVAQCFDGALRLIHVLDPSLYSDPSRDLMDYLRAGREKRLDQLLARAERSGANVDAHVLDGSPATELIKSTMAAKAELLVVSSGGQVAPTKWFTGSVVDQVVRTCPVPTLVAREPRKLIEWAHGERELRVLLGYDYSTTADAALDWLASFSRKVSCEVRILYVASSGRAGGRSGYCPAASPFYYSSELKKVLTTELKQRCDSVLGNGAAQVDISAGWGRPDSHLIERAADDSADMIIVGNNQHSGLARLLSVSRAVSHYAMTNLLCVPEPRPVRKMTASEPSRANRNVVPRAVPVSTGSRVGNRGSNSFCGVALAQSRHCVQNCPNYDDSDITSNSVVTFRIR